jgi:hypothetical protein
MDAVDTLRAFSRREASADAVMRALAMHERFFLAAAPPEGELWLFTDLDHAQKAAERGPIGSFSGPLDGVTALRAIDPRTRSVSINPLVDPETFWVVGHDAIPLAKAWAEAAWVEKALAARGSEQGARRMVEAMRAFHHWLVLAHPNDALVTALDVGGLANAALVFTATDCAEAALVALGNPKARRLVLTSEQLCTVLPKAGVDGFIVNVSGPGAQLTARIGLCDAILAA